MCVGVLPNQRRPSVVEHGRPSQNVDSALLTQDAMKSYGCLTRATRSGSRITNESKKCFGPFLETHFISIQVVDLSFTPTDR